MVESFKSSLAQFSENREVGTIDTANLVIDGIEVGTLLRNIANHSDAVVAKYLPLLPVLNSPEYPDFSSAVSQLSSIIEQSAKHIAELDQLEIDAKLKRGTVAQNAQEAATDRNTIGDLLTDINKDRDEVTRSKETANNQVVETETVVTKAGELRTAVDTYKGQFDAYQQSLDERESGLNGAQTKLDGLVDQATEHDRHISQTIEKAESMIAGATNAGLATTFSSQHSDLDNELRKARWGFYVSIALLAISAIPIAAFVFPGLAETVGLPTSQSPDQSGNVAFNLNDLLSRAILLLPFAWLAKFMASRHATLFRLREHYAYKYSMAMSVEGFKQQAPKFEDEVAMGTFTGLSFNPANLMDSKNLEETHPNPVIEWVMKKLGINERGESE